MIFSEDANLQKREKQVLRKMGVFCDIAEMVYLLNINVLTEMEILYVLPRYYHFFKVNTAERISEKMWYSKITL
jgi:hypothetical protein